MPPKTALDKMTNTTFPRVKRTSIVTVLILNSLSAMASSTSCFPSFSIMLQLISTRHFGEIKQDEMKTLRKKKTRPPQKTPQHPSPPKKTIQKINKTMKKKTREKTQKKPCKELLIVGH